MGTRKVAIYINTGNNYIVDNIIVVDDSHILAENEFFADDRMVTLGDFYDPINDLTMHEQHQDEEIFISTLKERITNFCNILIGTISHYNNNDEWFELSDKQKEEFTALRKAIKTTLKDMDTFTSINYNFYLPSIPIWFTEEEKSGIEHAKIQANIYFHSNTFAEPQIIQLG